MSFREDIERLLDKIAHLEAVQRDIQIDKILSDDVDNRTTNDKFIEELRDNLSTVINRNTYITKLYFKYPEQFMLEKNCDCKTHYENKEKFMDEVFKLWSLYKSYNDFTFDSIVSDKLIEMMEHKYLINKKM